MHRVLIFPDAVICRTANLRERGNLERRSRHLRDRDVAGEAEARSEIVHESVGVRPVGVKRQLAKKLKVKRERPHSTENLANVRGTFGQAAGGGRTQFDGQLSNPGKRVRPASGYAG